jgi:hypothetical protein
VSNTETVRRIDHIPANRTAPQEFSDAFTVEDIEIRVVRDPLDEVRVIPDPIMSTPKRAARSSG